MHKTNVIFNNEHKTSNRASLESTDIVSLVANSPRIDSSGLKSAENYSDESKATDFASIVSRVIQSTQERSSGDCGTPKAEEKVLPPVQDKFTTSNQKAMQLSLLQQQQTGGLKQLDKTVNCTAAIVAGHPPADSPNSNRGDASNPKESGGENPIAAAMVAAAAAAASGVPSGGLPFNPASLLSSQLGSQQIQQLLSQQILSPQQLQSLMQQHQVMAAQQHQAQQLQELYRQQQKHIHDIQIQMTRQHGKRTGAATSAQNDHNNNNNSGDEGKHSGDQNQQALQQQIALQQLVQLQQMQAQHHQQQQQAAALQQQQQGLAAAAAAALAHGRTLPPLSSPELQQIWKQMTESAAFQAAAVMAAASGKSRSADHFDTQSSEKMFSSPIEERKPIDMNGESVRRSSRESSPGTMDQGTACIYAHGVCKWPGCDTECADQVEFRRHLNQDHRLDDKSTAQCRVQMQVVEQLEKQLNKERERLNAMMSHLHNMEDIREQQQQQTQDNPGRNSQDSDDISRLNDHLTRPTLLKPDHHLMSVSHALTQPGAHIMGPMFNSMAGSVLGGAGSSLSLPASPNGFSSSMLSNSLSHSPPSMASHFSTGGSVNNLSGRDPSAMVQSTRRRHSNAIPISAELSQNQEFYKNADVRPPYTYASLIRQAIIETPDHQLTLNEIYNWFQRKFAYFRRNTATWKNAVRHNLSLHKCFVRVENVKGAVWTVDENEYQKRRPQKFSGSPIMRGRIEPQVYYGNSLNQTAMQMALGEHGFSPALFAASQQAQAALLSSQSAAGNFVKSQSATSVAEMMEESNRIRKRSASPSRNTMFGEDLVMDKIKRERAAEMTENNYESSSQSPPSIQEVKPDIRNANNNSSKYTGGGEYGSPEPQSPEMSTPLDMSRTSPILRAHGRMSDENDATAQRDVLQQQQMESDASGESDGALESSDIHQSHPATMIPTRGSFTMLQEQPSD
uniref:forkhead box protein P1-like isoform X1 n=1 Tax=Styela clava TaxID=7725 RepID=UPI001939D1B1|nr:forkhead box protein P1-like isoform X1 [Styela clava]